MRQAAAAGIVFRRLLQQRRRLVAKHLMQRIGVDHPRRHAVDANPERGELDCEVSDQAFGQRLAHPHCGIVRDNHTPAAAAQKKHRAAAAEQG